jgi:hypothetical protein
MSQQPVIDVLLQALITNDQVALNNLKSNRAEECTDLRAIISTDHPDAVELDLGLGVSSNEFITPIFEGPRAFFCRVTLAFKHESQVARQRRPSITR